MPSGYYAEHLSPQTETRNNNNSTVRVQTESKGIHLHNLSYAGPIVMGCGGKLAHFSFSVCKIFIAFLQIHKMYCVGTIVWPNTSSDL